MAHQMYQAVIKMNPYILYCFLNNKYNEPFNEKYYYVMQYLSQSQQIMGYTQQKHYAPHCLPPVAPTDPEPMTDPMIQTMTQHIQYHKNLMWMIM